GEAVGSLLASGFRLELDNLLPRIKLSAEECREAELTAKQALAVAVDAAVTAGERRRMLTTNMVFDALARHWSDHYLAVLQAGKAAISYDMKVTTVRASWRDLLRNGVRLEAARLYLDVKAVLADAAWHEKTATDIRNLLEEDYDIDITKSPARRRGRTWKRRLSPRQVELLRVKRRNIPRVKALVKQYD